MSLDFQPAALFFDMDGLLLDTEKAGMIAFTQITRPFEIAIEEAEAFYASLVGTSSAATQARVAEFIPGVDVEVFVENWHAALNRLMADAVPVKPTVREMLAAASGQGHRMAVVTSTRSDRARRHLERAGLLPHFETLVGGDDVDANKPDPAPYLETARRLGVLPADTVAFEDSDHGVASAVAAGCVAVQVPDVRPSDRPLPKLGQHVAPDLAHAMRILGLMS